MACKECRHIGDSSKDKPFINNGPGRVKADAFICPCCGQKWWRHNGHFNRWSKIDDEETWKNVLSGCSFAAVSIGATSHNV